MTTPGREATPTAASVSLRPAESMALTVALAQVLRGEEPMPNVATVCVLALARLTDRHDYEATPKGEPVSTPARQATP